MLPIKEWESQVAMELVTDSEELRSNYHITQKGWAEGPWAGRQVIWFLFQALPGIG